MKTDNELIAEFMGFSSVRTELDCFWNAPNMPPATIEKWQHHSNNLYFHSSWDWLMPVVEKIDKLYAEAFPSNEKFIQMILNKEKNIIDRHYMDVIAAPLATPISEAYKSVVDFIKWYNAQNP